MNLQSFVEICMKYNNKHEAMKYLPKVAPKNKVKCYYKVGWVEICFGYTFVVLAIAKYGIRYN